MEFFRIQRDIPFMRYAVILNVISALTFAAAVFFIATRGLHFSVEFTGGTLVEVAYPQAADLAKVRETVALPSSRRRVLGGRLASACRTWPARSQTLAVPTRSHI